MKAETMLELLQRYPPSRERSKRGHAIAYILKQKFPQLKDLEIDAIAEVIPYAETLARQWRQITEQNPWLRGTDYWKKGSLVKKKQLELGYKV